MQGERGITEGLASYVRSLSFEDLPNSILPFGEAQVADNFRYEAGRGWVSAGRRSWRRCSRAWKRSAT
jgi:hypothetical protein